MNTETDKKINKWAGLTVLQAQKVLIPLLRGSRGLSSGFLALPRYSKIPVIERPPRTIIANGKRYYIETNPAHLPVVSLMSLIKYCPKGANDTTSTLHYILARMARPMKLEGEGVWVPGHHDQREIDSYSADFLHGNFIEVYSAILHFSEILIATINAILDEDLIAAGQYGVSEEECRISLQKLAQIFE